MRSPFRTFLWALAILCLAGQDGARANPLKQELQHLLSSHPQVLSAEKTFAAARAGVDVARDDYWPRINFSADGGPEWVDEQGAASRSRPRKTGGASITQNLFNGFATSTGVAIARLNAEVAALTLEGTRQNMLLEGLRAYLNVLRQRRLIELSRDNEGNILTQLNLEDERVQRGAGVAVDVLQAKSRLQIAKERRVSFEGGLQEAIARYVQVFDHAPDLAAMYDPQPPVQMIPPDLDDAVDYALTRNPAIANSAANVEVARQNRTRVTSQRYPAVDLVGRWDVEHNKDGVEGTRRQWSVLLNSTLTLLPSGKRGDEERQAAFQYGASVDNADLVMRRVIEQTKLAWTQLTTATERVQLLENAVNIASEVFAARRKLREAGKETVINVLDAESEIFTARINFVGTSYDQVIGTYQLLLAMGELSEDRLGLQDP